MKTLQNNFTTPEQSKRLLELGMPADSADCYYLSLGRNTSNFNYPHYCYKPYSTLVEVDYCAIYTLYPCWSVGRLMVIYFISKGLDFWSPQFKKYQIENSTEYFVAIIANNIKDLDFSKLEE